MSKSLKVLRIDASGRQSGSSSRALLDEATKPNPVYKGQRSVPSSAGHAIVVFDAYIMTCETSACNGV